MALIPDTTLTPDTLRARLGGGTATSGTSEADATRLLEEAGGLVADALAGAFRDVPQWAVDLCVVRTARALKDGEKASTGGGQIGPPGSAPVLRSPADPLTTSYPIIRRYVVMGV